MGSELSREISRTADGILIKFHSQLLQKCCSPLRGVKMQFIRLDQGPKTLSGPWLPQEKGCLRPWCLSTHCPLVPAGTTVSGTSYLL